MRIALLDPPGFTPPYDHSLAAALARRGHDVHLLTSPDLHGSAGAPDGYRRHETYLPLSGRLLRRRPRSRARVLVKGLEYVPSVLRSSRSLSRLKPDVVHVQWLGIPRYDVRWLRDLAGRYPVVLTAHDVLPRRSWNARAWGEALGLVDRVVVHSERAVDQLSDAGLARTRLARIPHAVFEAPNGRDPRAPDGRTMLFFGLLREYKGVDVLLRALPRIRRGRAGRAARDRGRAAGAGRAARRAGGSARARGRRRMAPPLRTRSGADGAVRGGGLRRLSVQAARLLGRPRDRARLRSARGRLGRRLARPHRPRVRRGPCRAAPRIPARSRPRASSCSPIRPRSRRRPPVRARPREPSRGTPPPRSTSASTARCWSRGRERVRTAPGPGAREGGARSGRGRRPARPSLAGARRHRALGLPRVRAARPLRQPPGGQGRRPVPDAEVPLDDSGRGRSGGRARPRRSVRARRERPSRHAKRALPPAHRPRRDAAARERPPRRDVARRARGPTSSSRRRTTRRRTGGGSPSGPASPGGRRSTGARTWTGHSGSVSTPGTWSTGRSGSISASSSARSGSSSAGSPCRWRTP